MLDIVILAVLVLFAVHGFSHGLVREVCSVLGVIIAAIIGFLFADACAVAIKGTLGISMQVARVSAFLAIFLGLAVGLYLLGLALSKLTTFVLLKPIDKVGGAAIGLLEGIIVMGIVLAAMSTFIGIHKALESSTLARAIADLFSKIFSVLAS